MSPTTVLRSDDAPPFVQNRPTRAQESTSGHLNPWVTEPNLDLPLTNLLADHAPQPWPALLRLPTVLSAYEERVATLREYGEADGITLRAASEGAFLNFIKSNAYTRQASLVLLDNGNLRAVWKSDDGSHVGVQFRGGQAASYVIFKRRDHGAETSRVAGKDTLDGVRGQIRAFGLEQLMSG